MGALKAVVATASLELGIDMGEVELVIQIGSPRRSLGAAPAHRPGVPLGRRDAEGADPRDDRDDLLECAAAVRAIQAGRIDRPVQREAPLDILAQQLVATLRGGGRGTVEALWALARRAGPYVQLERRGLRSDHGDDARRRDRRPGAGGRGAAPPRSHSWHSARGRRGARLAAITSGGAIPDKADYTVVEDASEASVGTVDEDFAIDSMAGDIFQLGSHAWRVRRVEQGRVRVEDAQGQSPNIPFWNGEGLARTAELSAEVAQLRASCGHCRPRATRSRGAGAAGEECGVATAAAQALAYIDEGAQALGAVPTQECLVAERFFDESGGMQLIIHAPFGARINRAFGMGLRKKFCRSFDFELQAAATDDAVLLSLGPQHSFPLERSSSSCTSTRSTRR
jgi:ATP-dependent Lhr-like helicase